MNVRRDRPVEAERYRQLILAEFPESNYAKAMSDPNYLDNLRSMFARQEALYDEAYADYLADNNADVHKAYERMVTEYPLSPLMPKFMFLHALAFVTDNKPDEFGATLKELLERYPETDVTPMASSYLKGLAQGRKLRSGGSNMRGMLWDIRLSNDSTATGDGTEIEFVLEPEEPHYLVLLFSTENISPNQLLFDVARHNFTTYMVRDFDLEVMNFGRLGLLLIKGFRNEGELNHYRSLLAQDNGVIIPEGVRPVQISKSNFEKLLHGGGSFDDYFRFIGEETVKATHESVLPPEEYPSAEEMYAQSEDGNSDLSDRSDQSDESDQSDQPDESDQPGNSPAKMNQPDSLNLPKAVVTLPSDTTAIQPATPVPNTSAQPEAKPSVNPEAKPSTQPAPKSSTQPASKKTPQPVVPKPKVKTEPKKQPVPQPKTKTVTPVTTPKLPDYPLGSEGDEDD